MYTHTKLIAATLAVASLAVSPALAQDAVDAAQQGVGTTPQDTTGMTGATADNMTDGTRTPVAGTDAAPRAQPGATPMNAGVDSGANENALGVLQTSTEAALTRGGFDDLVERFVDADRNRIGQSPPSNAQLAQLDQLIGQFQQAWTDKYGGEFQIDDRLAVFDNRYQVEYGEIGDRGIPPSNLPGRAFPAGAPLPPAERPGVTDPAAPRVASPAGSRVDQTVVAPASPDLSDTVGNDAEDANLEPGRSVATIGVPAEGQEQALRVPLVYEFPGVYKIDAPDTLTGRSLEANLTRELRAAYDDRASWPADEQQAFRVVNRRVLAAIFDGGADDDGTNGAVPATADPAIDGM